MKFTAAVSALFIASASAFAPSSFSTQQVSNNKVMNKQKDID